MGNNIPDYSNLRMDLKGLNTYMKDFDVNLNSADKQKLITIFKKSDTFQAAGEKKELYLLTGKEREDFLKTIKKEMPDLYRQMVDFYTLVDSIDDMKEMGKTQKK